MENMVLNKILLKATPGWAIGFDPSSAAGFP